MEILVFIVRKLVGSGFRYYVFMMHIHRSIIYSCIKLLILPLDALICISFRSRRSQIHALSYSQYLGLLTNAEHEVSMVIKQLYSTLIPLQYGQILNLIVSPGISIQQMIISDLLMTSTFQMSSHTIKKIVGKKNLKHSLRLKSHQY